MTLKWPCTSVCGQFTDPDTDQVFSVTSGRLKCTVFTQPQTQAKMICQWESQRLTKSSRQGPSISRTEFNLWIFFFSNENFFAHFQPKGDSSQVGNPTTSFSQTVTNLFCSWLAKLPWNSPPKVDPAAAPAPWYLNNWHSRFIIIDPRRIGKGKNLTCSSSYWYD